LQRCNHYTQKVQRRMGRVVQCSERVNKCSWCLCTGMVMGLRV
jgi:hypothetical protein